MGKEIIVLEDSEKPMQDNFLHRGQLQVFAEILNFCQEPQVKTRIMYQTNLSYTTLQKCLLQLLGCELLEVHKSKKRYATTKKGFRFLSKWKELAELLQP